MNWLLYAYHVKSCVNIGECCLYRKPSDNIGQCRLSLVVSMHIDSIKRVPKLLTQTKIRNSLVVFVKGELRISERLIQYSLNLYILISIIIHNLTLFSVTYDSAKRSVLGFLIEKFICLLSGKVNG